jgi:hypothetical protein
MWRPDDLPRLLVECAYSKRALLVAVMGTPVGGKRIASSDRSVVGGGPLALRTPRTATRPASDLSSALVKVLTGC